jgi:hypothetical protein
MMKTISIALILLLFVVPCAHATSLQGGTLLIVDASGSGGGQGVAEATDNDNLREKSLHALLSASWIDAAKRQPTIAVITCSDRPEMLLLPTHDRAALDAFLKGVHLHSSGGTTIAATVRLLGQLPGRPDDIVYLGDGLLTSDHLQSSRVVRQLPATLVAVYGKAPRLHAIAIDASHEVFSRTEPAWTAITEGRVVKVRSAADIDQAVNMTACNLLWLKTTSPRLHPEAVPPTGRPSSLPTTGAILALLALILVFLRLQLGGASPNAVVTIEENGHTRRASARSFGKRSVSIGEGSCDIKLPKWDKPITLLQRMVVDPRGRKRAQTVAQHGNRSVILGPAPVSFSNGTTTVRLRGGRR